MFLARFSVSPPAKLALANIVWCSFGFVVAASTWSIIDYRLSTTVPSEFCRFWFLQAVELVWFAVYFFVLFNWWLANVSHAGRLWATEAGAGPVFHTEAWRWRSVDVPGGCVMDGLGNFWYPDFLAHTAQSVCPFSPFFFFFFLFFSFFFGVGFFFFPFVFFFFPWWRVIFLILQALDCQCCYITFNKYTFIIIKRWSIWTSIMAVYVYLKSTHDFMFIPGLHVQS